MQVSEKQEGDVYVLQVEGRLDASTSPVLERKIESIVEVGAKKLLIDFEKLDYLSSAGMRLLLTTGKKLQDGGRLAVCSIGSDVMEVIKMAGFDRVLNLYSSEKEALESY